MRVILGVSEEMSYLSDHNLGDEKKNSCFLRKNYEFCGSSSDC